MIRLARHAATFTTGLAVLATPSMALGDEPANASPGEVPPVPDPSPVVLGGEPTPPDRVGTLLGWQFRRFSTFDYLMTGVGGAITLTAAIVPPRSTHSVSGGILFDDRARRALAARDVNTRYAFRDASDVGVSLVVTWPFFADSLVTAWWYRGSRDVAEQMALLNLETLAVTGAIQGTTNVLVSRERPFGEDCGTAALPSAVDDCAGSFRYRSFFSGHAAFSFTSAALVCMNHFENDLLGPPWDAVSCAGGYAVAATTATFRVAADVHYASDVMAGALLGTLVGYGIPLLHYRHPEVGTVRTGGLKLRIVPTVAGASAVGIF